VKKKITVPICDWDIIVFLRSHSGEIGSSISVSLSPCAAIHTVVVVFKYADLRNNQPTLKLVLLSSSRSD